MPIEPFAAVVAFSIAVTVVTAILFVAFVLNEG